MDRPTIIPADPVAAAEMAEQEANAELAKKREPTLAEQNERTGRTPPTRSDLDAAEQRGRTA